MALLRPDVAPGHHEHRVPLAHRVAHEGVLRLQVEDVELVDARRHHHQRALAPPRRCAGAYWMSWISSFSYTTWPGVTARLRPTSKAVSSVWLMRPLRHVGEQVGEPAREALAARLHAPGAGPSGLVAAKFAGLIASTHCRTAKRRRSLACASSAAPSTSFSGTRRRAGRTASGSCNTGCRATPSREAPVARLRARRALRLAGGKRVPQLQLLLEVGRLQRADAVAVQVQLREIVRRPRLAGRAGRQAQPVLAPCRCRPARSRRRRLPGTVGNSRRAYFAPHKQAGQTLHDSSLMRRR